jgi:hypothetical protein
MWRAPQPTSNTITNTGRTNRRYRSFALIDLFKMISCFLVIEFILLASWINFAVHNGWLYAPTGHKWAGIGLGLRAV